MPTVSECFPKFCVELPAAHQEYAGMSEPISREATSASTASSQSVSQRLMSLDALRGFDMFWIAAAEPLVAALGKMAEGGGHKGGFSLIGLVANQLEHAEWEGFHFEDLIFPLFVF